MSLESPRGGTGLQDDPSKSKCSSPQFLFPLLFLSCFLVSSRLGSFPFNESSSILCLQHSYREVGILLLYLAVGVSVFSGIAYTAEYEEVKLKPRLTVDV